MEIKVCALGILFRNGKILLGKRAKRRTSYPNVWDMIGGHCESDETLEQTLIRELQEEIGVTPIRFEHISTLYDSNNDHTYYVFVVKDWKGEPECLQPEEHARIGWFSINETLKLELALPVYRDLFTSLEGN
ncbi:MAG: NUDIX domain-containing protein [Candidatus Poribacteria bacterium]|nr:NUDIX domain-containing protein [Candidatus Poribacteria bacterium]